MNAAVVVEREMEVEVEVEVVAVTAIGLHTCSLLIAKAPSSPVTSLKLGRSH
jgi:hypothetical protein